MNYVIIENGVVIDRVGNNPASLFAPGYAARFVEAPDGVSPGWRHTPTGFKPPSPTREDLKAQRQAAVDAVKVTTSSGKVFDGDETSQTRMARAIVGLQAAGAPSLTWVLADNTPAQVSAAELTEALILAGQAQAAVWVIE